MRLAYEPQLLIASAQIGMWKSDARKVYTKRNFPKLLGAIDLLKVSFMCLKVAFCTIFKSYRCLSERNRKIPGSKRPSPRARADQLLPAPKEHNAEHTITTGGLLLTEMRALVEHVLWPGLG